MDAAQALAELRELSSQVERAVVLEPGGDILAATDDDRAEVELADGGFFVLREGGRTIGATTGPGPTSGLVVYDLRTCLQAIDDKPKRRRTTKKAAGEQETPE